MITLYVLYGVLSAAQLFDTSRPLYEKERNKESTQTTHSSAQCVLHVYCMVYRSEQEFNKIKNKNKNIRMYNPW